MSFEKELEKGQFCIPECMVCKKLVWPPSEFCDKCDGETSLKKEEFEGKIIEFSRQNEEYFCMVEFCDSIPDNFIHHGTQEELWLECGIDKNNYFFHVI